MFSLEREFEVDARLLRKNERAKSYKVTKSKKYDEVQYQMKGGNKEDEKM